MSSVIRYNELKKNLINYNKPEKVGASYFAPISYEETLKPIYIQTPKMECIINKDNKYIECEINDKNYDFYDFITTFDDLNIRTTYSNSDEWFDKSLPLEAIDDMYKRTTRPVKRNEKPKIRFKIPYNNGKLQCSIYNQDRIYMDINNLSENHGLILILHLRGLRIYKTSFIFDIYISQIKVFLNKDIKYNIIDNYSIIDDEENNDNIFNEEIYKSSNEKKHEEENNEIYLKSTINVDQKDQEKQEEQEGKKNQEGQEDQINNDQDIERKNSNNEQEKEKEEIVNEEEIENEKIEEKLKNELNRKNRILKLQQEIMKKNQEIKGLEN